MVDIKLFNNVLSVTADTKKAIFQLKKLHISLAKIHNQLIFLKRCQKSNIIPKSFLLKLPFKSKFSENLRIKFGKQLIAEQISNLLAKFKRSKNEEIKLRSSIIWFFLPTDWLTVWNYIVTLEKNAFQSSRESCISKFNFLCSLKNLATPSLKNKETVKPFKVVNLSSKVLNNSENSLLNKGLSFVPFTNSFNKFDIAATAEYTAKAQDLVCIPGIVKSALKDSCIGKRNLTNREQFALDSLKKDCSVVIQNSDKGKVVVVLDKNDYLDKLDNIVKSDSYKKLNSNPIDTIQKNLDKLFAKFRSKAFTPKLPKYLTFRIRKEFSRHPSIYGQVKVHKPGFPLRPIVTNYKTILEFASKFLTNIFNKYANSCPFKTTVKNTHQVIKNLNSLTYSSSYKLVSFDVVNLFGSIDQSECIELITGLLNNDALWEDRYDFNKLFVIELAKLCITTSYFCYNDEFYEQSKGVPMGSPLSPVLADIVMINLEIKISQLDLFSLIKLWNRYVDDVLSLWNGSDEELDVFLNTINLINPNIQFTMEKEENGSIPFLDIRITKSESSFTTRMYSKPTDSGLITNFKSFHPPNVLGNIVKTQANRVLTLSDSPSNDLLLLSEKFQNNDFPLQVINNSIKSVRNQTASNVSNNSDDKKTPYLILPYMGNRTKRLQKATKGLNLKLVAKKNSSLNSIFSKNFKYNTNFDAGVIYKLTCSCGQFYIGETGRKLEIRINDHKNAIRLKYTYNAMYSHIDAHPDHIIDFNNVQILARESHTEKRKIKEAMFIQKLKPDLNQNQGLQLVQNWNQFVPTSFYKTVTS